MAAIYYFHYLDNRSGVIIRIQAKVTPSLYSRPSNGTWIVREYYPPAARWMMPNFPEITWGTLSKYFTYLGKTKKEEQHDP